jgi:two-component system, NtrC family, nitrogen regulation response regulator GlnG
MKVAEKILIVEDDSFILTFTSKVLKSQGYLVTTAMTGKDALAKVQTSNYNLVLLDIGLPDMTGTEILRKIREINHDIIVIMMTGNPQLDSSVDSVNYGADGYLIKPVNDTDLVDIVKEKIKQRFNRLVNNDFI